MKWAFTASFSLGSSSIVVFEVEIEKPCKSCCCVFSWSLYTATDAVAVDIDTEKGC